MTAAAPKSVYIHVPFCRHRCGYCDFTLVANRDDLIGDYLTALESEIGATEPGKRVETVFFGGGTPTHLAPQELSRLFTLVAGHFDLAADGEFSVEANPEDLTDDRIAVLAEAGVNRISLGVQSFDSQVLHTLERGHRPDQVRDVVERLRPMIPNISLDLIFGVPGQSLESWEATLAHATELRPRHVSTYGLTYEKGTSFWSRRARGELVQMHSEIDRTMYQLAIDHLGEHDLEQYELSNFARSGSECRHNETYWAARPYYAFGPGAARFADNRRETNHRSVFKWLALIEQGRSPVAESELLSNEDLAREVMILGLRRVGGFRRSDLTTRFGLTADELAGDAIARHLQLGNITDDGDGIRLTAEGRFVADSVVVDFL